MNWLDKFVHQILKVLTAIFLMNVSVEVLAQQAEIFGIETMDNITRQRLTTTVAVNKFRPNLVEGKVGHYIVLGSDVPLRVFTDILNDIQSVRDEWNIVMAYDTKNYYGRTGDIAIGAAYNKEDFPVTEPISSKDFAIFTDKKRLGEHFIRSKYKNNYQIDKAGNISDFNIKKPVTYLRQNTIRITDDWTDSMWIEDISSSSLETLTALLGDNDSLVNYLEIEKRDAKNKLEKIALRNYFILQIVSKF